MNSPTPAQLTAAHIAALDARQNPASTDASIVDAAITSTFAELDRTGQVIIPAALILYASQLLDELGAGKGIVQDLRGYLHTTDTKTEPVTRLTDFDPGDTPFDGVKADLALKHMRRGGAAPAD